MDPCIRVRGARTHNLKNLDVDIPRNRLVVLTGVSGSGKTSLAFDTLYAEGQRRYVESLSAYARQFLDQMERPDVDSIEGLSPAVSISQRSSASNPRSTVGTVTEILDYLRLLFARVGVPYCPVHGIGLKRTSPSEMADLVLESWQDKRIMILSPTVRSQAMVWEKYLADLQTQGFVRFRIDGAVYEVDSLPLLSKQEQHDVDVVVDRLRVRPAQRQRIVESFETAVRLSHGHAIVAGMDQDVELPMSTLFACPECGWSVPALEPKLFSFNSPQGACPACTGVGTVEQFDPALVVANPGASLQDGAIPGWDARNRQGFRKIEALAAAQGFSVGEPWSGLSGQARDAVLYGAGDGSFEGVIPLLERQWSRSSSQASREGYMRLRSVRPCAACGSSRLNQEARSVRIGLAGAQKTFPEITQMPLSDCAAYFEAFDPGEGSKEIAAPIVTEILARLGFLQAVGLGYLTLSRSTDSLSGGERQRIRLASQIGSGLSGVMYVLDEPSIGLHQSDSAQLIAMLRRLRDLGNSVIVVEHDEDMIRAADWVADIGPGAGRSGGRLIACGSPGELAANPASLTGAYLSGARAIRVPSGRLAPSGQWLELAGARGNNLKNVTARFPVGLLTVVSGVSGSGKSTLVNDTLYRAVSRALYRSSEIPEPYEDIRGLECFDKIINVDQSPIGRVPRSNPATYTGLFAAVRDLFAQTPTARERGYGSGRFSFNVPGGRCEQCQGNGFVKVEMNFLPDLWVPCKCCHGRRFNRETLDVLYKGKTIADVLDLTVEEAAEFFSNVPAVLRRLSLLREVGLGYLKLGQSATTLSGGEAQRLKLSAELARRSTGRTLYVLDEPTTGLHFSDIAILLDVLIRLRDAGNTIIVIEHNMDVLKVADWIIDMGPGGGQAGGRIIAQGTPEQVAGNPDSCTGRYLGAVLRRAASAAADLR